MEPTSEVLVTYYGVLDQVPSPLTGAMVNIASVCQTSLDNCDQTGTCMYDDDPNSMNDDLNDDGTACEEVMYCANPILCPEPTAPSFRIEKADNETVYVTT